LEARLAATKTSKAPHGTTGNLQSRPPAPTLKPPSLARLMVYLTASELTSTLLEGPLAEPTLEKITILKTQKKEKKPNH